MSELWLNLSNGQSAITVAVTRGDWNVTELTLAVTEMSLNYHYTMTALLLNYDYNVTTDMTATCLKHHYIMTTVQLGCI